MFTLTGHKRRMSLSRVSIIILWSAAHLYNVNIVFFFNHDNKTLDSATHTQVIPNVIIDFSTFCCYPCVAGTKPLHCFRVHHWMVNAVQRSPFFKNIILTVGEWNFAIWREEVMVTAPAAATAPARVKDH